MGAVKILRAAILLSMLAVTTAGAQMSNLVRPDDPVPDAGGVTYLDLVREIVPDMKRDGNRFTGTRTIDLPHADASYNDMRPPEKPHLDQDIEAVALGGTRHLLLIDLGEADGDAANFAVLALFDASRSPRLLAALGVGFDRWSFFLTPAVRPLGAGRLIMTGSEHRNSSQTYMTTALVLLRDDRFDPIDNIWTLGEARCSFDRPQQLTVTTKESTAPFADVVATVTDYVFPTGSDCGDEKPPQASSRKITVTYGWDAAQSRYTADSDAFERLAVQNSDRF